jgi:AraC-like DNA-binding protein
MSPSFERVLVERFDPDRLIETVSQGRFEHRLLDGGPFQAELSRLVLANVRLDSGWFSRPCFARGAFPADWMCLGLSIARSEAPTVNGMKVAAGELQVYAEGSALDYRSAPHARWMAVQVRREYLQQQALAVSGCELDLPARGWRNLRLKTSDSIALQTEFARALELGARLNTGRHDWRALEAAERSLLATIVQAMARQRGDNRAAERIARRMRVVRVAEQFLLTHAEGPFRIEALAAATETSERSLEYLFKEVYGVSPRDWFLSARLNRVRRELAHASDATGGVAAAANRWGIRHLGRFAGEYRKMFGELPSRTLANSLANGGGSHLPARSM